MARQNVKQAIFAIIAERHEVSMGDLARRLDISRQAVHWHMATLLSERKVERVGSGRSTTYRIPHVPAWSQSFRREGLEEDAVWSKIASVEAIGALPENVRALVQHGLTEMVNNAIEHSQGTMVWVELRDLDGAVAFEVQDDGLGIFKHVMQTRGLKTPFEAVADLQKGKVTTAPRGHTGEGIFFSSKMADKMTLDGGSTRWAIDTIRDDHSIENIAPVIGTRVHFRVAKGSPRTLQKVYEPYTGEGGFVRTRTVIKLFRDAGGEMVSRSEAKRLLVGLEKFEEVEFDFRGVPGVGQGFADEVFRVWQREHPRIRLSPVNMNESVRFMVNRARVAAADEERGVSPLQETLFDQAEGRVLSASGQAPTASAAVGKVTKTS